MNEFSYLWNDLTSEQRTSLMPYEIQTHILHLEQSKAKAVESHKKLMRDFNSHIASLTHELSKYRDDQGE